MAEVFPPPGVDLGTPDWGFKQSPSVNADVTKLGDGYEFREKVGLNAVEKTFNPVWSFLDPDEAEQAYDFLEPKVKTVGVLWRHPITNVQYKVVPDAISIEWDTWGNAILDVTFRQDFNPG